MDIVSKGAFVINGNAGIDNTVFPYGHAGVYYGSSHHNGTRINSGMAARGFAP